MSSEYRSMLEIAQDEMIMRDRILEILRREGPKNVPELAEALGAPSREIVIWLSGLRRYGLVEEKGRADVDGYYKYEAVEKDEEEKSDA